MRTLILLIALSLIGAVPVFAERLTETDPPPATAEREPSRADRLDTLFDTLKSSTDPKAAKSAENDIIGLWLQSGSDTIDLLMQWALAAIEEKNYPLALDYLDRMIVMQPDFAEAWNKRATVHFLLDDYSRAISDIERTLQLEPRHFGALSGLGAIMRDIGERERAIAAYRRALEFDPHLDKVKEALQEIEKETAGRDI
jgi:tetratricopeptide (TPR) repeat protein